MTASRAKIREVAGGQLIEDEAMKLSSFSMIKDKRVFCWNCKGTGSSNFLREMREILKFYRSLIVILLEPKISDVVVDGVCKRLGLTR